MNATGNLPTSAAKSTTGGPFLSVVVPTYNRARMLDRCIQSVLASVSTDFELLVSDNASPDNTQEVLRRFEDPRMRSWRNPANVGAEPNILGLWQKARGDWIFCLTDDDYLFPGALDRLILLLRQKPDVGVILSDLQVVDEAGNRQWVYEFHKSEAEFSPGIEALKKMVWAAHVFSRIAFRREWADLAGVERHLKSMYPQMYMVGSVLKEHRGFYLKEALVAHTTGNKTFWDYPADMMVSTRIDLIKEMLPGTRWAKARRVLIGQIIREIRKYHHRSSWKEGRWLARQKEFVKAPEVRQSPAYWLGALRFLLSRKG